ncbi:energy-coupling factor ABC transporter ATP-binding protein [Providencia manganoxydans]|uniref:energy-coupling factor ABC transporter ATP-binding protein n=1 Tax=Providencia manganoxydans TaxID=2923283 RepID=UPI0034E5BF74
MVVVNLQQLSFTPKTANTSILGPIDIQLTEGEWLGIFGGNGSGKSTLAQLLCGWLPELMSGELTGTGDVFSLPLTEGNLVTLSTQRQLIQQSPQLQLSGCTFSVEQEIAFGPENQGIPEEQIYQRVDEAIALTHCETLRHRHPSTLSGGEAQRVVMASALAMQPKLLLLDEAFSRLTPKATHSLLINLKNYTLKTGCSVILFERHLLPAFGFCQQVMLLDAGKTIASIDRQRVFAAAQSTINMPDAWRALGYLINQHGWNINIPNNDDELLHVLKDKYAAI